MFQNAHWVAYWEKIIKVSDNSLFVCVQKLYFIHHYRIMIYLKHVFQCFKMPTDVYWLIVCVHQSRIHQQPYANDMASADYDAQLVAGV